MEMPHLACNLHLYRDAQFRATETLGTPQMFSFLLESREALGVTLHPLLHEDPSSNFQNPCK